jgi:N-acetylmuramoyl-L-alanine amidase
LNCSESALAGSGFQKEGSGTHSGELLLRSFLDQVGFSPTNKQMSLKPLGSNSSRWIAPALLIAVATFFLSGCASPPGKFSPRKGDEIMVAGQFVHTGTRVVTWMDPGGYDAYRVEKRFSTPGTTESKTDQSRPRMGFSLRRGDLSETEIERVRGGGWDLPTLQKVVDQFVVHYDVAAASRSCFRTLHDVRGLAVHFMLDLDGTIYQTLDLKEGAWHATSSNDRSVGIEICNMGAYPQAQHQDMEKWYRRESDGRTAEVIPSWIGTNAQLTPNFIGHPARRKAVVGEVHGKELRQYDFTPQQYSALAKLTATLCKTFPKMNCDYPRNASGKLVTDKLPEAELEKYQGVLGHFHVQKDKTDPGPAFQWDYVIGNARRLMGPAGQQHGVEARPVQLLRDN